MIERGSKILEAIERGFWVNYADFDNIEDFIRECGIVMTPGISDLFRYFFDKRKFRDLVAQYRRGGNAKSIALKYAYDDLQPKQTFPIQDRKARFDHHSAALMRRWKPQDAQGPNPDKRRADRTSEGRHKK